MLSCIKNVANVIYVLEAMMHARKLTVGVQEGEHLRLGHAGAQQPGRDEPLALLLPHHPHHLQLVHVVVQPALQVVCNEATLRQPRPIF